MPEPERIGTLIQQLMRRRSLVRRKAEHGAHRVLADLLGPAAAGQVRVVEVRGGTLRLGISSAPLRQELAVYRSAEILQTLHARLPELGVRGVRFEMD